MIYSNFCNRDLKKFCRKIFFCYLPMITNEVFFTKINGSEFAMLIFHENHVSSIANSEKQFIIPHIPIQS
jgi:hypothetical protein